MFSKTKILATSFLSFALLGLNPHAHAESSTSGLDTSNPQMPLLFAVGGQEVMSLDLTGLTILGTLSATDTTLKTLVMRGGFTTQENSSALFNGPVTFQNPAVNFQRFVNFNDGLQITTTSTDSTAPLLAMGSKYQFVVSNEGQQLSMYATSVKGAGIWMNSTDGSILLGGGGATKATTPTVFLGGTDGHATFSGSGYFGGTLTVKGTLTANNGVWSTSDKRLKKDITPLAEDGLGIISELKPVTFEWKAPERAAEGIQVGFIAQDVQSVLPPAVQQASPTDDTLRIRYDTFIPVIVKAMQEQQKIVEDQATEIETLKADVAKLSAQH